MNIKRKKSIDNKLKICPTFKLVKKKEKETEDKVNVL